MTAREICEYRGYEIVAQRQWSGWCVGVYPTRADLPILARSTLQTRASHKPEAISEAKKTIDSILSSVEKKGNVELALGNG